MQVLSFTMDMDWAPSQVIEYALHLFEDYSVKCTLFLTNEVPENIKLNGHEVAVHPNFKNMNLLEETVSNLLNIVPESIGCRSHALFYAWQLLPIYAKYGICYDSSVVMYNMPSIFPYKLTSSIWELPIFYLDYIHLWINRETEAAKETSFKTTSFHLNTDGLKIFDFHPMHIFLNTDTLERYEAAKPYYHDPDKLREFMNPESSGTGIRVLLKRILAQATEQAQSIKTLSEITNLLNHNNTIHIQGI
jgi:hypothetical protein